MFISPGTIMEVSLFYSQRKKKKKRERERDTKSPLTINPRQVDMALSPVWVPL